MAANIYKMQAAAGILYIISVTTNLYKNARRGGHIILYYALKQQVILERSLSPVPLSLQHKVMRGYSPHPHKFQKMRGVPCSP